MKTKSKLFYYLALPFYLLGRLFMDLAFWIEGQTSWEENA